MTRYAGIFDSHTHYDDAAFDADRDSLLRSVLPEKGVCGVVNCGADLASSAASAALAAKYAYIYAAAGIHPECVKDLADGWEETLRSLLIKPKIVAVGEIGLDYHFAENAPRERQQEVFKRQVLLANELRTTDGHRLPVVVHDREAHADTLRILQELRPAGVVHCFSGSVEMARQILDLGMYIGLGGAVTFKNARVPVEVAAMVPEDRLLLETDCPYMAPGPFRGTRNDSSLIAYTAERIAAARDTDPQALIVLARRNAERLFGIPEE